VIDLLLQLAMIVLSARLLGWLAARAGQPAVVGELLAGVLLGASVLNWVHETPILHMLGAVGVLLLLFEVGLDSDLHAFLRVGPAALRVAVIGVVVPFALGYVIARAFGMPPFPAVFVGATLTATSVGISARVLADVRASDSAEGRIILGAAVIDDVLGLLILALLLALSGSGGIAWPDIARSAGIIGAFAIGLWLAQTRQRARLQRLTAPAAALFVPVFFVLIGAAVNIRLLNPFAAGQIPIVLFAAALTLMALLGKLASGLGAGQGVNRGAIGVAMMPRGEVGLIFAGIGMAGHFIDDGQYAAIVMMVTLTTLLAPILLKRMLPPPVSARTTETASGEE